MTIEQPVARALPVAPRHFAHGRQVFRDLFRQVSVILATCYLGLLTVVSLVVWIGSPMDPNAQDLTHRLNGPSAHHLLGLDALGRDVLARLVHATPVTFLAILEGVAVAAVLGVVPGLIAGFRGGALDAVMTKIADAFIVFPGLVLALAIIGALGPGLTNAMIAVGVLLAPGIYRVVRATTISVRQETYVQAARTMGTSNAGILARHVLPNVMSPLLVQLSLTASLVLLIEASLSYLGLGVQPPAATFGSMIKDAQQSMVSQPLLALFPGIAILLTALSFNLVADGLTRALKRRGLGADNS
ncbi:MAG TPA: ABC transporter permease [Amycolatopsis sp.]|nr:ABC transporter permease [Amycolatopsis sp.]